MKSLLLDAVLVCAGLLAIRRVPEHGSPVPAILICLGAAAVVFAISLPPVLFEDFGDSYYLAGKAVLDPLVALPLIGPDVDAEGFGLHRLAWLGILLTTPVVLALSFSNPTLMTLYTSFGVSHVLLGGLIWFGLLARARVLSVGDPAAPQPRRGLGTPWIDRRVARDAGQ